MSVNPDLVWSEPQLLGAYPYEPELSEIPNQAGIYVFFRKHGKVREALYVGKALNVRSRVKGQLNNRKLMEGVRDFNKTGGRHLTYAKVSLKTGQTAKAAIHAAEKILIRHFIEDGHELLNIQGKKIKLQTLRNTFPSALKNFIPEVAQVDA